MKFSSIIVFFIVASAMLLPLSNANASVGADTNPAQPRPINIGTAIEQGTQARPELERQQFQNEMLRQRTEQSKKTFRAYK